ncbi:Tol-Pal system protein TolB [Sulfurimonas lithotrophica]|uniref:Tol-Pal system protein TolB n=1 Tax=Sulfurimonas lithotrophica TaxID=2590022 RepID=A0A5P8P068_9BACT|nr:Tol-Pal system protein TolB [Sulfurimonas lithotrophica]QFR49001.1 Tol-Pal system protein TolB [Sulfurimonas lithotrophica]
MKILFSILISVTFLFASDATIEVIKKVDSLPALAVEDSSVHNDETFKLRFFKALIADLNVLSLFNVDRHHVLSDYDTDTVDVRNKDMEYVLKYKIEPQDVGFVLEMKIISKNEIVLSKKYKINDSNKYMFVAHTIAYEINEFMEQPSIEWMKKKVIFSRIVGPKRSEIVIADYTLAYQHIVVKGGFNLFPKWSSQKQNGFYYTSLNEQKPTLKYVDTRDGSVRDIISSEGMMTCSDVNLDGSKLLLTMAPKGQPDIYMYDVASKISKKLTNFRGIDVGAQFKENNKIVFISNRLGYPNVFSKNIDTGDIEQMVYYGKNNSACTANGEYVIYKARESSNAFSKNTFNLHMISTKTDFIRRLTASGVNEFPRFSKDSDAVLFIKNYKNQSSIGIIRLNHNKNYLFPLKYGKLQAMDW